MNIFRAVPISAMGLAALLFQTSVWSASITPETFSATISIGETVSVEKTVALDADTAATSVDIFFLSDNTGSMGGIINTVKSFADNLLSTLSTNITDVAFGVGRYLGDPVEGVAPATAYQLQQSITTDTTPVMTQIGNWFARGGGDSPETNFFALQQVATEGASTGGGVSTGQATGWRDGARRVILWFGDASSHEETVSQTEVIDALTDENVIVIGLNTRPSNSGIDTAGQASAITDATEGSLFNNLSSASPAVVQQAILDGIDAATSTLDITLATFGDTSGLDISVVCTSLEGCDDVPAGGIRTLRMDITGVSAGVFNFETRVPGLAGVMEIDSITVTDGSGIPEAIPEPASILLLGLGLTILGINRKRAPAA